VLAIAGLSEERFAENRTAGLSEHERSIDALILERFAAGQAPARAELEPAVADEELDEILERLVAADLIQLGPGAALLAAYPFSARPTRHRVRLVDGRSYWAMCALDAFGIPQLLEQPAEIDAREPESETSIHAALDPASDGATWTPRDAVVLAASSGSSCLAGCACPHINLFASEGAAERYLAARPKLRGGTLSVIDAVAAGRRLFGDLLGRLPSSETT